MGFRHQMFTVYSYTINKCFPRLRPNSAILSICQSPKVRAEMIGLIMRSMFGLGIDSSCLMVMLGRSA